MDKKTSEKKLKVVEDTKLSSFYRGNQYHNPFMTPKVQCVLIFSKTIIVSTKLTLKKNLSLLANLAQF